MQNRQHVAPAGVHSNRHAHDGDYTSEVFDTHKTEQRRVLYRWHPLYGKELNVCGERNRHGKVMLICRSDDGSLLAPLEVPAWMFDATVCWRFIAARSPRVEAQSLIALRSLFAAVTSRTHVVIQAHQSTIPGGFDAQDKQAGADATCSISGEAANAGTAGERQSEIAPSARETSANGRRSSIVEPGTQDGRS